MRVQQQTHTFIHRRQLKHVSFSFEIITIFNNTTFKYQWQIFWKNMMKMTHTHTRSMEDDEKNALHSINWRQPSIVFTRTLK